MKILHVIPWLAPRYGGPATLVPEACAALAARGHDVEIVSTNADGAAVLPVPTGGIIDWNGARTTFHPVDLPARYLTSWSLLADLRRRLSTFDVVHTHGLYRFPGLAAATIARSSGIPYLIQAHGSLDPWHRRHRQSAKDLYHLFVEDPVIDGAAAMVCTSAREQDSIRRLGYIVPTQVVPVGVNAAQLRATDSVMVAAIDGVSAELRVVTFLGRISAKKGLPLLVESFGRIASGIPNAHLVVAGPDDEGIARDLLPGIARAGLADRVSFVGLLGASEKRSLLQRSDVFVLPSADESFGIAVAEAMAVGCPVVISPNVAIEDVVRPAGAGLVVDRDPVAIANAVVEILSDRDRAAEMGAAGRRIVDERFAWTSLAEQLEALYASVIETKRRSSRPSGIKVRLTGADASGSAVGVCPRCRSRLEALTCRTCGWHGRESSGIPVLLADPDMAEHDELGHDHANGQKAAQAAHFDQPEREAFEIDRPHGTPRLYRYLLGQKARRAAGPIRPHLVGAPALVVCGGSGMDAEMLAWTGAVVTTSDLSLGAAIRAKSRSERYGVGLRSIVADVEGLPFADQSFDVVSVHDGLHHLNDPVAGLSEMARVARRWVLVTEPAQASLTRLAVRFGLALDKEAAGNRVARLDPQEVAAFLQARGFVVLRAERYAMYYPHHPGALFGLLSLPVLFPMARLAWRGANSVVGRFGNKMVVVAERDQTLNGRLDQSDG